MLATAPKKKFGEAIWAPISGFAASLPATIHDLIDAYWVKGPEGLSPTRLIDVAVTLVFLGLSIAMLIRGGNKTAEEVLQEILNPSAAGTSNVTPTRRWTIPRVIAVALIVLAIAIGTLYWRASLG